MHKLAEFQQDMRVAYLRGATGITTSGLVWLAAGLVAYVDEPSRAVWTLFLGAMFIVPVSNLIDRVFGAPGKHTAGNRLGWLAMESTVFMIMCLPLAYGLSLFKIEWFFPAVLMIIGGRYLIFATVFGTRVYWLLGSILGAAAVVAFKFAFPPHASAFLGAAIELVFGIVLLAVQRRGT